MTGPEPPFGSVVRDGDGNLWEHTAPIHGEPDMWWLLDNQWQWPTRVLWTVLADDCHLLASAGEWADRLPTPTDEQPGGEYMLGWNDCRYTLHAMTAPEPPVGGAWTQGG